MHMAWYLSKLFFSLVLGVLAAKMLGKHRFHTATALILDGVLYGLLFFMGVNTGQIPDITTQIAQIGYTALVSAGLAVVGCIVLSLALAFYFRVAQGNLHREKVGFSWSRLKTPLVFISIVALGVVASLETTLFSWFNSGFISPLLYLLLFFVGMQMVQHEVNLVPLLKSPLMVLTPLCTVFGTYLGALAIPLLTELSLRDSMAVVSGFGWYTLSGVLLSDLGSPELGAISFLSNLFRESAAFILIPLLASFSFPSIAGVTIAGATSMDVTLPLLKKSFSDSVVPLAIVHGGVITLLAPFLIPFWFV
jgi:uncharacterized membrane protein YbjE (DUF340 family)